MLEQKPSVVDDETERSRARSWAATLSDGSLEYDPDSVNAVGFLKVSILQAADPSNKTNGILKHVQKVLLTTVAESTHVFLTLHTPQAAQVAKTIMSTLFARFGDHASRRVLQSTHMMNARDEAIIREWQLEKDVSYWGAPLQQAAPPDIPRPTVPYSKQYLREWETYADACNEAASSTTIMPSAGSSIMLDAGPSSIAPMTRSRCESALVQYAEERQLLEEELAAYQPEEINIEKASIKSRVNEKMEMLEDLKTRAHSPAAPDDLRKQNCDAREGNQRFGGSLF